MRFLFTAPRYHTNQHYAVKALRNAGHEVAFLAMRRGQSEVYEETRPIVLGEASAARTAATVWRRMRELGPDVVVVRDPPTALGLASIAAARLTGRRVVFYTQGEMHRRVRWWSRLALALPAWAARAGWMTPVLGRPDRHPPALRALRYVPFVMEPQTAPEEREWLRDGAVNVMSVGKFEPRKNHRLLLRALARLSERRDVRATIVGECTTETHRRELAETRRRVASDGLDGRVRIRTNVSYRDVQAEYPRHDLFVLPSNDEPAAVSHLEAMAHSMPVICSDANGTRCYVRPGENGYVFRADDADDLEACMERVVADRGAMEAMGARSYELVLSEHAPSRYVEAMTAIAGERG